MIKKCLGAFLLVVVLGSCGGTFRKVNFEEDQDEVVEYMNRFHSLLRKGDYVSAKKWFAPSLPDSLLTRMFAIQDSMVGLMISDSLTSIRTDFSVKSKHREGKAEVIYECKYAKGKVREEIVIEIINDSLKISGLHPIVELR